MNREIPEHIRSNMEKNAEPKKPTDRFHERRGELLACDDDAPLAENFSDEFKDQRIQEISQALQEMGFALVGTSIEVDKIIFRGRRDDKTMMEIVITKGEDYTSPKDYDWEKDHE